MIVLKSKSEEVGKSYYVLGKGNDKSRRLDDISPSASSYETKSLN